MYINKAQLTHLQTELAHVAAALLNDQPVLLHDPVDGWVETKQINLFRPASDYHIGSRAPS